MPVGFPTAVISVSFFINIMIQRRGAFAAVTDKHSSPKMPATFIPGFFGFLIDSAFAALLHFAHSQGSFVDCSLK